MQRVRRHVIIMTTGDDIMRLKMQKMHGHEYHDMTAGDAEDAS